MDNRLMRNELDGVRMAVRKATNEWETRFVYDSGTQSVEADNEYVKYLIRIAYLSMVAFLDKYKLAKLSEYLDNEWKKMDENLLESYMSDYAEIPLLVVTGAFWEIIEALSNITFEPDSKGIVHCDLTVMTILKRIDLSAYKLGINFEKESDIDKLAEALLLPFFPDLNSSPSLTLGESSRHPDSAIPSIRTLLEYKIITKKLDVARVIDEIQADVRNYPQEPWEHLIFLVGQTQLYTTEERLKMTILKEPTTFKSIEIILVTHSIGVKSELATLI